MNTGERQSQDFVDFYSLLKVDSSATIEEIERAYQHAIRYWHPDNFMLRPKHYQEEAARTSVLLNQGRELLTSPDRKALYDNLLREWQGTIVGGLFRKDRDASKEQIASTHLRFFASVLGFGMVSIKVQVHIPSILSWAWGSVLGGSIITIQGFTSEPGFQGYWMPPNCFIEPRPGSEKPFALVKRAMGESQRSALVDVLIGGVEARTAVLVPSSGPWMTLIPYSHYEEDDPYQWLDGLLSVDYPRPLFGLSWDGDFSERDKTMAMSLVEMLSDD